MRVGSDDQPATSTNMPTCLETYTPRMKEVHTTHNSHGCVDIIASQVKKDKKKVFHALTGAAHVNA